MELASFHRLDVFFSKTEGFSLALQLYLLIFIISLFNDHIGMLFNSLLQRFLFMTNIEKLHEDLHLLLASNQIKGDNRQ